MCVVCAVIIVSISNENRQKKKIPIESKSNKMANNIYKLQNEDESVQSKNVCGVEEKISPKKSQLRLKSKQQQQQKTPFNVRFC